MMSSKVTEKLNAQVEVAKLEARAHVANEELSFAKEELARIGRRVAEVEAGTAAAHARAAELVTQTHDLEQQQRRLKENAAAIRDAISVVNSNAGADHGSEDANLAAQRAVNEALFKLGQQLEAAEGERSRLTQASEDMERTVSDLRWGAGGVGAAKAGKAVQSWHRALPPPPLWQRFQGRPRGGHHGPAGQGRRGDGPGRPDDWRRRPPPVRHSQAGGARRVVAHRRRERAHHGRRDRRCVASASERATPWWPHLSSAPFLLVQLRSLTRTRPCGMPRARSRAR